MKQSRMDFNRQILEMIDKNPSSMHREYHEFYAVHVYLRSIRISLLEIRIYMICWTSRLNNWDQKLSSKIFVKQNLGNKKQTWKKTVLILKRDILKIDKIVCNRLVNLDNKVPNWNKYNFEEIESCHFRQEKIWTKYYFKNVSNNCVQIRTFGRTKKSFWFECSQSNKPWTIKF